MMNWRQGLNAVVFLAILAATGNVLAFGGHQQMYEVTVTNITKGQVFSPIMVASHRGGVKIFKLGSRASDELEVLAESGDTGPLTEFLKSAGALDVVTAGEGLPLGESVLLPGKSVTLAVATDGRNRYVSVAAMLVSSNDAFVALNGVEGPKGRGTLTLVSPAYDAGTEDNDELCVNVPGPPCGGSENPPGGEDYIYIHSGIHGVGDLVAADHDWKNPVARITIRATRKAKSE